MTYLKHIILAALLLGPLSASAQKLKYKADGTFRIMQVTDTHLDAKAPKLRDSTFTDMRTILHAERPDLVVLTGDIVWHPDPAPWQEVVDFFNKEKQPFAYVFGNHDRETATEQQVFDILETSPYFLGHRCDESVDGVSNYVLPIAGRDKAAAALIYCINSHRYRKSYGEYDWIKFNQIEWYRRESAAYTRANGGKPVPALAFFHIPLQEYAEVEADSLAIGRGRHEITTSEVNSGFYCAMAEMGDIKGAFCGHDHENDFVGLKHDIALGFGRRSGTEGDGVARGARIIELTEGETAQYATWIATPTGRETYFYYPSGVTSDMEAAMKPWPALDIKHSKRHGVAYTYYEYPGRFRGFADKERANHVEKGTLPYFSIDGAKKEDFFSFEYETVIDVPETAMYRFTTFSDDESGIEIDGRLALYNSNKKGGYRQSCYVPLAKGCHTMKVMYREVEWGQDLEVTYSDKHCADRPIPQEWLYIK